ncbi:MAG: SAF domain-containing protein [Planctomycetota bacterium]
MPSRKRSPRRSPLANLAIAFAVLGGLGVAGYAMANYFGLFQAEPKVAAKPSREGKVPVPKSLVSLKAYEKVRREDIYDREIGDDSYFWLPRATVEANPDWVLTAGGIIGRVLASDKRPEFVFSEKDFLPEGSRTGLAAGVPVGKQGFFLQASLVPGLRLLKMGDEFDLMASVPEASAEAGSEYGLLMGGIKVLGKKPIPINGVRLLVQGGTIVALTDGKAMTTQGAMEFPSVGTRGRASGGEQIAIAIDPEEVVPLTQALGSNLTIHAVARSGQELETVERADELEGLVPFPASAVEIKAYQRITAKDLTDRQTGEPRQYYFRPESAPGNWIGAVDQLLGRVVRRDIDSGYIFSESDLLPLDCVIREVVAYSRIEADDLADPSSSDFVGRVVATDLLPGQPVLESNLLPPNAAPGIAGGIPPNKMAVTVSADQINGLAALSRGDLFDIIGSAPVNLQQRLGGDVQLVGGLTPTLSGRAVNTVIATEALVVQRSHDRVTLAVDPDEVAALTRALAVKTPVFTIARSGRIRGSDSGSPADPLEFVRLPPLQSDPDPMTDVVLRESISGDSKKVMAFRRPVEP